MRRQRRIRQWTKQIKDRTNTDITPWLHSIFHRFVKQGREQEANAYLVDAGLHAFLRCIHFHPQSPQNVGASRLARYRAVPCLATRTPAPATTKAQVVEILKVPFWSPPVPQVSRTVLDWTLTRCAFSRIRRAAPVISSTVSPFILSAVRKDATCKGVASPVMISFITVMVSSSDRLTRLTSFSIASRIFILAPNLIDGWRRRWESSP